MTATENSILGSETMTSATAAVAFLALLDAPARPALRLVKTEPAPAPAPAPADSEAVRTIEAAQVPAAPLRTDARRMTQTERSAALRALLKSLGVKGVSVTSARGSMCYWSHIRFDGVPHPPVANWCEHNSRVCDVCQRNNAAERKVHRIVLAAYPDLDDRSDSQTDHFDFVYTVDVSR